MVTILHRDPLVGMVRQMITVPVWVNSDTMNSDDDHYDIMMTLLMTLTTIALGV